LDAGSQHNVTWKVTTACEYIKPSPQLNYAGGVVPGKVLEHKNTSRESFTPNPEYKYETADRAIFANT
jgi:hypothetical protein